MSKEPSENRKRGFWCFDGSGRFDDAPVSERAVRLNAIVWRMWRLPVAAWTGPRFRGLRGGTWRGA